MAHVLPLLKKAGIDSSLPSNYRQISNLSTVCKVIKRLVLAPGAAEGNEEWGVKERAVMASAGARGYNGGLGAKPPAGSRGRAPGQGSGSQGAKPPEAEKLFAFRHPSEAANLPYSPC